MVVCVRAGGVGRDGKGWEGTGRDGEGYYREEEGGETRGKVGDTRSKCML